MINPDDRSAGQVAAASGGGATSSIPKCVCSWKNCRKYQKAFRECKHPVFDGVVKLKFVKDHPASQSLKDSVDRTLRVPPERADDWKPGRKEGQLVSRYYVARHHYTEKHIQKSLADPKAFSFLKPFSIHGAKKYLFTVDNKETFDMPGNSSNQETLYLQCPNVPKEVVKAAVNRLKDPNYKEGGTSSGTSGNNKTPEGSSAKKPATTTGSSRVPAQGVGEKKDSLTVSTTRSQQQLEKEVKSKEMENKKLKDELDMMKSQLGFLHDMVRKLQEEHFDHGDHQSVRSGRSYRSRSASNRQHNNHSSSTHNANQHHPGGANNNNSTRATNHNSARSMRSGVPREINFGEDEDEDWNQANGEDWTEYPDDQTHGVVDDDDDDDEATQATFQVTYKAQRRNSGGGMSVASRGGMSIVSASRSVKTLPRELELDEDEDDSDSHESLEDDAFSYASTAYSRSGHNRNSGHSRGGGADYGDSDGSSHSKYNPMSGGGGGGSQHRKQSIVNNKKPSRRGSIGDSSHRSARSTTTSQSAGTYEVSAMDVTDPYGEKGTYTGSISNSTGMPHGFGRLEYDRAGRWYEGDWKHGRWTGHGQLSNGDGDFYEGGLKNDHKHGQGIMKFADGRTFEGEYINGQMIEGKMTYQDGSTYEGSWVDGMRHGRGKCVFTDDSVYEGEFREGEFSGQGRMAWSDGGWYEGEWWNGEMHGLGREVRPDGSIRHDGEWAKGQPIRK